MSFVSRKTPGCDSTPHSQHRGRIADHSSRHVDESSTKSTGNNVKYQDLQTADQEDEYTDQCEVHG